MLSFTQFAVLALGAIPFSFSAPVESTTSSFAATLGSNSQSWTTSSRVPNHKPLNDNTLNIYKGSGPHAYTNAPDGSASMQAVYQKGSISPGHTSTSGGFTLYAKGPIDLSKGTEITFSYSAYFENGFDFNKGGKMPGLYGGTTDQVATTCSGGRHDPACWSARMMWRTSGAGELYAYVPQTSVNANALANAIPKTHVAPNDVYGTSVGRGSFKWKTGAWTNISQRVKLNTVGKADGEIEISVDGKSTIRVTGLELRTSSSSRVRGMQIQTFFGGHDSTWASPKKQSCYFKDFSAAIIN